MGSHPQPAQDAVENIYRMTREAAAWKNQGRGRERKEKHLDFRFMESRYKSLFC